MKKALFITFCVALSTSLNAQITLSKIDFATGGDTVRMSNTTKPTIDFTTTGPNAVWNFSTLTPISQQVKKFQSLTGAPGFILFVYGVFAPLKYQASYFMENTTLPISQITSVLPVTIDNVNQFMRRSNDSLTAIGYSMSVSGTTIPLKSDTIETKYKFPLHFGDTHFSRGYTLVDFNPVVNAKWIQHRKRTTVVDGYGSITTPYGTFDALRVKHSIKETDSLYYVFPILGGTWIPLSLPVTVEYEWLANGQKEPILKITTQKILNNETVTAIEYRDSYRGLDAGIETLSVEVGVFPNPVVSELTITAGETISSLRIVDASGKIQREEKDIHANKYVLDVSQLPNGVYEVQLFAGDKRGHGSFVKQ
jgi:hypothetical protein